MNIYVIKQEDSHIHRKRDKRSLKYLLVCTLPFWLICWVFRKISKVVIFSVLPLGMFADTQTPEESASTKLDLKVPLKKGQLAIQADDTSVGTDEHGRAVMKGNVVIARDNDRIQAQEARVGFENRNFKDVLLSDDVRITYSNLRLVSNGPLLATSNPKTFSAQDNFRIGNGSILIAGSKLEGKQLFGEEQKHYFGTDNEQQYFFELADPLVYFHEPDPYSLNVTGSKVRFYSGSHVLVDDATIRIGKVPVFWLPTMILPAEKWPILLSGEVGLNSSKLGGYFQSTTRYRFFEEFDAGANLDFYTKRGLLFGPVANYSFHDETQSLKGGISTGYIHDYGSEDRGYDIMDQAVPKDRGFIMWQHRQLIDKTLTINGSVSYWSDSEVYRDFREDEFDRDQQPSSFVEVTKSLRDFVVSGISSFQVNEGYQQTQRLPEIRVDMLTTPIADNLFFQRGNLSFAHLETDAPVGTDTTDLVQRSNLYYGLYKPFRLSDFANFTVNGSGQVTHYSKTGIPEEDSYTRFIGQFGADLELVAYNQWDINSKRWNINGLRHVVRPVVSYRYMPNADVGTKNFDKVDRYTVTSRKPTIDLGDMRNIDDMHNMHLVRYGFRNVIETRSQTGKSPSDYDRRELATFDIFNDYYIQEFDSDNRFSDIYTDVTLSPTYWFSMDFYNRYNVEDSRDKEFNGGLTFKDGDLWNFRVGKLYRNENSDHYDQYTFDLYYRLNEDTGFNLDLRYDNDKSKFTEQTYAISRRIGYSWLVTFEFTVDSDVKSNEINKQETDYQFMVKLRLLNF